MRRSRDQLLGISVYHGRKRCAVWKCRRCKDEQDLTHIVHPEEIRRGCNKQVPGLIELAKAGAACAVAIHRIRAGKRRVGDDAIQANRRWATDVSRLVQRQHGVSRPWADTDYRPAVRGAICSRCSCKRAGSVLCRRCHAGY